MSNDAGQLQRAAARRLLQSLNIEAIEEIDIEAIAAFKKLFVVADDLQGAEGRSVTHEGAGVIRIGRDVTQPARRRFVIAHEIGHCILHTTGSVTPCSDGDLFRYEEGNREAEANWFAAELLMPGALFRPLCKKVDRPRFEAIEALARVCSTTLTATAIRFVNLSGERCALVWSEKNAVKWAVRSDDFPGFIERGRKLSSFSLASNVFSSKPLPKGSEPVPQHAWLDRAHGSIDLQEETLAFTRLGAALTLLWLPEEDEDDGR